MIVHKFEKFAELSVNGLRNSINYSVNKALAIEDPEDRQEALDFLADLSQALNETYEEWTND